MSHCELVTEQRADPTLKELFQVGPPTDDVKTFAGSFIQKKVLLKKMGDMPRVSMEILYISLKIFGLNLH